MSEVSQPKHVRIPLDQIHPSPFNPRKQYDQDKLAALAISIQQVGQLAPLIVRKVSLPIADSKLRKFGYEIVAGHRRFAALLLIKATEANCDVRDLTDTEVRGIQLIENIEREDVLPSEQAAGVQELIDLEGLDGAAKRLGKTVSAVRSLAALAGVPKWFVAHVDAGDVSVSAAELVARVPGERDRKECAVAVLVGGVTSGAPWHQIASDLDKGRSLETAIGEWFAADRRPMTVRQTKDLISTRYCKELKGARFSRKALELVPGVGSCDACPKRSGNNPEMVAAGVRADICTDLDCYGRKTRAAELEAVAKFRKQHKVGILIQDSEIVASTRISGRGFGYLDLDGLVPEQFGIPAEKKFEKLTVREWLDKAKVKYQPMLMLTNPVSEVVDEKKARKAMELAGYLNKPGSDRVATKPAKGAVTVSGDMAYDEDAIDDDGPEAGWNNAQAESVDELPNRSYVAICPTGFEDLFTAIGYQEAADNVQWDPKFTTASTDPVILAQLAAEAILERIGDYLTASGVALYEETK